MLWGRRAWSDKQVEQVVGGLLRGGVMLAAVVVLIGGLLYLDHFGTTAPDYRVFRGEPTDLRSVTGIVRTALALHSRAIIQFGLLLLIATPVARVGFSVLAFALQRDLAYVLITLFVLAALLYSLAGGRL